MNNTLIALTLTLEGRQMFLEFASPTNQILYQSICEQFDIPAKEAKKLRQIFNRASSDIEQVLKEIN